jgi:signal transduction histidine kinase/FixJ family two-component response regulator
MTGKSERILVIDDEVRMCESLRELLSDAGYNVETEQSAPIAIEKINNNSYDLIITDIKMPEVSGLEILESARKVDPDAIVILMTGFASLESSLEAIKNGAFEYLLKPVEFSQLEISVKRGLEIRETNLARNKLLNDLKIANLNLNNRLNEINALYEAGNSMVAISGLNRLLDRIVSLAAGVTDAEIGSVMLIDSNYEHLTIASAIGLDRNLLEEVKLPLGESIAGYVAKSGQPLMVSDVEKDERFKRINKERYKSASLLCVPLKIANKILGVINMAKKRGGEEFNEHDLKLLTTFASQAALFIDDTRQAEENFQKLNEFSVLFELTRELSTVGSVSAMRAAVFENLKKLMPIDYALWFEWQENLVSLKPVGATGTSLPLTDTGSFNLQKIRQEDIVLDNIDFSQVKFEDIQGLSEYLVGVISDYPAFPEPDENFTALPVLQEGDLKHVFCISTTENHKYTSQEISLARLVISQASGFYEREKALLNATRLLTMGNMISEISHDLRRPLTNIRGGLQILREKWPDIAQNSDFFKMAEAEILRLNELVKELVDFSKPHKYETEIADVRMIIKRAVELLNPEIKKKKIRYIEEYSECSYEFALNKNQILEVFLNLFLNSVDAMTAEGVLKVTGKIGRPSFKKQDYLAISVSDTGCGIKAEHLSKIFDRYYTSKKTGTGLGLAVVERIISAHGGTLSVNSTVGKGTDFTLYFPV